MSDMTEYLSDFMFEDPPEDLEEPELARTEKITSCRYCNENGVYWAILNQKWRLHNVKDNKPHVCDEYYKDRAAQCPNRSNSPSRSVNP